MIDSRNSVSEPLLEIRDLSVDFSTDEGMLHAVSGVSLRLERGRVLGLVGESGCGKSVTAMSIPGLVPQPPGKIVSGEILFKGENLLNAASKRLQELRGREIGVVFQEPMTSLSPLHRIEKQLAEVYRLHTQASPEEIRRRSLDWLRRVGMADPERVMRAYPFELSGGMRQRVMIAMAMLLEPDLIIADEPTTALDVTIQAQILDLMRRLRSQSSGLLLITHDMGVIWEMCDEVAVMYASRLVEKASVKELFEHPLHPYTRGLMKAIPGAGCRGRLEAIPGQVPSLLHLPEGCPFADRCDKARGCCHQGFPPMKEVSSGHFCSCALL